MELTSRELSVLAVDCGAESVRVVAGGFDGERLEMREVRRFPNRPRRLAGGLAWDLAAFEAGIREGIAAAGPVRSIAIDGWGVDFALLRPDGSLAAPPRSYRDPITAGILPRLFERVPRDRLFRRTGIQMLEINTLCQLLALRLAGAPELDEARRLVLIPDLLLHRLGAEPAVERTNASTTQFLAAGGGWARDLLAACDVDPDLPAPLAEAASVAGRLGPAALVRTATHDTAAAVVATPLRTGGAGAFISSGTWSVVGLELPGPVIGAAALAANLSNEEGFGRTTRLLRNVMGLWLVQRCREAWGGEYEELATLAERGRPFAAIVDPDDPSLLRAEHMPSALAAHIAATGQPVPGDRASLLRAVLEGLALRYRWTLEALEAASGVRPDVVHVVGGGSRHRLLCQLTASACGLPVVAGPEEATATGNAIVQLIALGELGSVAEGRRLVEATCGLRRYEPVGIGWEEAFARFCAFYGGPPRPA